MPLYNLLEYSKNYRKTGSLWNYYRDEPSDSISSDSESFKYKTSITGKTPENDDSLTNAKLVTPLKYLSLNIPLINCEVELILIWSNIYVLADKTTRNAEDGNPVILAPSGAKFKITDTKLCVPVATLLNKMMQNF